MGYMRHHAIVVSSWNEELLRKAHAQADAVFTAFRSQEERRSLADLVSPVIPYIVNGGGSFLIAPDGSKEGWETSNVANQARDHLIAWLNEQRYEDGSSALRWVEVQFADDEYNTRITRDSDEVLRSQPVVLLPSSSTPDTRHKRQAGT